MENHGIMNSVITMFQNSEITFLTEDQIFGSNTLRIFKEYEKKAGITDFSILLGGYVDDFEKIKDTLGTHFTGWWWTQSPYNDIAARAVSLNGIIDWDYVNFRDGGARPALPYSLISSLSSNEVRVKKGIKEVQFGEYPQWVVDKTLACELEKQYTNNSLTKTGKTYTTDSIKYDAYDACFWERDHIEYEYQGKKYIRFVGDYNGEEEILSDGTEIKGGKPYWIKVEPITWIVDENANIALSKYLLFAGVQYDLQKDYQKDFNRTNIKKFLNTYFAKDIVGQQIIQKQEEQVKETMRRPNPYGFSFDKVSEEDIIKGAVQSNVAVFLHGRSSDGKSARVKQLDPDCEIIYMRNATPDSLNGKSVYNSSTGEMIDVPPTWYQNLKEKCEKEPDKIHILFFDELTNALPSIQGMAFNIVLDKEVNGKWKLPENVRIVAAGNDLNDSLAANQMAEPLFNRFAHVYINTTVDSWLEWATTQNESYERLDYQETEESRPKIHPAVYGYVAYKSFAHQEVLRTPYTGEKPNADPRKWEMASKVLYETKQPEMLRALIGEELTRDFVTFSKQSFLTVEDVINHNYTSEEVNEMNTSMKFATAVGLSSVDQEHFEIVRDFMKEVGAEPKAAFESMWTHGDEGRLEHLAELKLKEQSMEQLPQGGKGK